MTSLQSGLKQIPLNGGYYINVASVFTTTALNTGTDAAPNFSVGAFQSTVSTGQISTNVCTAGQAVFRDMGTTIVSSTRVFRKVQLLRNTSSLVLGGTDGVTGNSSTPGAYLTSFIELPGTGGYSSGTGTITPVARLG
jgi:hypothetical protein